MGEQQQQRQGAVTPLLPSTTLTVFSTRRRSASSAESPPTSPLGTGFLNRGLRARGDDTGLARVRPRTLARNSHERWHGVINIEVLSEYSDRLDNNGYAWSQRLRTVVTYGPRQQRLRRSQTDAVAQTLLFQQSGKEADDRGRVRGAARCRGPRR